MIQRTKKYLLFVASLFCLMSCGKSDPKISVFCDHIQTISRQEGISFAQAASQVKSMGYDAADVWVFTTEQIMKTLDSLGFEHSCAVGYIDFFGDNREANEKQCLDFVTKYGYSRLMIIPSGRRGSTISDQEVIGRIADFVEKANAMGVDVLFEDNDQLQAYVHSGADLEKIFAAIPSAGHAFDTGNYLANGEDCLEAYTKFRDRIRHVHLKDRYSPVNMQSCASFIGCIPMEKMVRDLMKSGYDGYYTIEIFDSRHMLADVEASIRNLKDVFSGKSIQPVKKDIGVQLYSVQGLDSDFEGALDRLSGMGYTSVEISNYSLGGTMFGYTPAQLKDVIESHGLKLKSSNTRGAGVDINNEEQCLENWKQVFADHKAMGCKYLALVGIFRWGDEAMAQKTCQLLDKIGRLGREYGIDFLYHNHNMEYHPLEGSDISPIEYMLQHTDPQAVNFELDVYWTMQGKRDPVQMINSYPDRIHVLHIKDYYVLGESGKLDFKGIFDAFYANGKEDYFVEMEPETTIEQADMTALSMYNISERVGTGRRGPAPSKTPSPAEDPSTILDRSLNDVAQSCCFILSAPFVR